MGAADKADSSVYRHPSAEQCHPFDSLFKLQGASAVCLSGLQSSIMPILEEDKQICKARLVAAVEPAELFMYNTLDVRR